MERPFASPFLHGRFTLLQRPPNMPPKISKYLRSHLHRRRQNAAAETGVGIPLGMTETVIFTFVGSERMEYASLTSLKLSSAALSQFLSGDTHNFTECFLISASVAPFLMPRTS
jgi:hypothetical protein